MAEDIRREGKSSKIDKKNKRTSTRQGGGKDAGATNCAIGLIRSFLGMTPRQSGIPDAGQSRKRAVDNKKKTKNGVLKLRARMGPLSAPST